MRRYARIIIYLVIALVIFLTFSIITIIEVVHTDTFKKDIVAKLKDETGADFTYEKMNFSIFPRISVVISNLTYDLKNNQSHYSGMLESMIIYPKITELLRKKIKINEITLHSPKLNYEVDTDAVRKGLSKEHLSVLKLFENSMSELAGLSVKFKGIKLKINNGLLNLITDEKKTLSFNSVDIEIISREEFVNIAITCNSSLFKSLYSNLNIDTSRLNGQLNIRLTGAAPHELTKYFKTDTKYKIKNSKLDLNLHIKQFNLGAGGKKFIKGDVSGNLDRFKLNISNRSTLIEGKKFNGYFSLNENNSKFTIEELDLVNPAININGEIIINNNPKTVTLLIGGNHFNVDPVHKFSNSFFGESGLAGKIFNVVREGHIIWIEVKSKAVSIDKLFRGGNYEIKGKINMGKIYIPKLDWILNDVYGDARISDHVLDGKNLRGRHNSTFATDGSLKLGLTKKKDILELDTAFKGDLDSVPFYMKQFVKNEKLLKEIFSITDIIGTAEGRLTLGDKKSSVDFKIDASDIKLRANYPRIPYAVNITGGNFLYKKTRVETKDLAGNISKSSFKGISFIYDWSKDQLLNIPDLTADLSLDEFYPWISSFEKLNKYLKKFRLDEGIMSISALDFKGYPLKPSEWQFQVNGTGTVHNRNSLKFSYNVHKKDQEIEIKNLSLEDKFSDLKLNIGYEKKLKELELIGNLSGSTLNNLVKNSNKFDGYLNSDMRLNLYDDQLVTDGELEGHYMHCGMYFVARVQGSGELTVLDLNIKNEDSELGDTIECFTNKPSPITGKYNFTVDIKSNGKPENLKKLMQGTYSFKSRNGTIMREEELFFKIFSILNISTLFKGKLGTINDENLTYAEINSSGKIEDGKFIINNGELYGPSTGLLANGYIDPIDKHMDIHLKTTPLEAIDWFIRIIPFLEQIQTKKFIYIPVHIVGWFDEPQFDLINQIQ